MRLRITQTIALAAFGCGLAVPDSIVTGDATRLAVTFLGLVAAGILPSISLIIGGVSATGRSVKAVESLHVELQRSMSALFILFGWVGAAMVGFLIHALALPDLPVRVAWPSAEITAIELNFGVAITKFGLGVAFGSGAMAVMRAFDIPAILKRNLAIRRENALADARKRIEDNLPQAPELKAMFPTHPDHGRRRDLSDLKD